MKVVKRIGVIICSVVLWCVILLAALYAFTTLATRDDSNVANIAGYTPMVVQTNSMAPKFYQGDLIFIKKCNPASLKENDIITFHTIIENQYALNTHRIVSIDESNSVRSYTTKGDNNAISDTHVISDGDIVGVYVGHISKLGKVMDFLSGSVGFMIVIVLPMLIFFIYQVYHLIMVSVNLKKAVAMENADKKAEAQNEEAAKARTEAEAMLAEAQRLRQEAEAMKIDHGDKNTEQNPVEEQTNEKAGVEEKNE